MKGIIRLLLAACGAWATCRDSAQYSCTNLIRAYGCDACCLSGRQSVRTACPASCGLCAAPTSGPGHEAEQEALIGLYHSTSGTAWTRRDRWLDANGSYCFWFGVNCDEDGKVARLELYTNGLSGAMPVQLASLTHLARLHLEKNSLSGTVPVELATLTQLAWLSLGTNRLSGAMPVQLASLTQLTVLYLHTNRLSGTVHAELASLAKLTGLYLNTNRLSGTVHAELASLAKLTVLDLGTNRLSGAVPIEIADLTQLTELYLYSNRLSGTVPAELASLTQLAWLNLYANRLSGTVPVKLASLTQLGEVYLEANRLSGAMPVQLASLTKLTVLNLHTNRLSGAVPVELASLAKLTGLNLHTNRLSCTVPVVLASLTQLTELYLNTNRLSGTVPAELASLTQLTVYSMHSNRLSGTVPVKLASLTQLIQLDLDTNRLSGTVPVKLASLTQLAWLYLDANSLSGTVPAELASLTLLGEVYLEVNRLSGTVPVKLASLAKLARLSLNTNRLSGTVHAELVSLTQLIQLDLGTNRLSGTVPVKLASLAKLAWLHLDTNRLSGTVPVKLANLTQLAGLNLAKNAISGDLPMSLPTSLEQLVLHHNSLSGRLPSFGSLSSLKVLTLFDNNLWGRLQLPHAAPQLQVLAVHRNRLSCPVQYNSSSYNLSDHGPQYQHGALLAPGNRISSAGKPSWALTSEVTFQWVPETFWQEWQLEIGFATMGLVGTVLVVGVLLKSEWRSFFWFKPRGSYEQLAWLCVRLLCGLSLVGLVCLVPVYTMGAGEFECGQAWLRPTLAYLKGSRASELAAAVLLCVLLGVQGFVATSMRPWLRAIRAGEMKAGPVTALSWQRRLAIAVVWPLVVLVFSIPGFLATLAKSVPGDQNTLGLSQSVLDGFAVAISPVLSFIDTVLVPYTVRWLVGKQGARLAAGMMLMARFVIMLVAPLVAALVLGSDCMGLWIEVWEPCQSSGHFNMQYTTPEHTESTGYTVVRYLKSTTTITQHSEVCDAQSLAYGRCPRFVLESIAELIVAKQIFTVFMSPLMTVLLSLHWVVAARRWAMRVLLRMEYTRTLDFDLELVLLSMVLDEVLVLGLAVPLVLPLGCLAVASRLTAVHLVTSRLGVEFEHSQGAVPAWWFFLVSLLLGAALLLWFFVSNAGLISGSLIFYVGAPVGLLVGGSLSWAWHLKRRGAVDGVPQVLLRPLGTASPEGAARIHAQSGDKIADHDHADFKYTLFEDGE